MNNTPRTAAAAINTALFHIGSRPRRTPEKMKPGTVAPKRSDVTIGCSCVSVYAAGEDAALCDTAIVSVAGTAAAVGSNPVLDNTSGWTDGASAEAVSWTGDTVATALCRRDVNGKNARAPRRSEAATSAIKRLPLLHCSDATARARVTRKTRD